jgi:stage II sporulation protein D
MGAHSTIVRGSTRKLRLLLAFAVASTLLLPSRARADVTFDMYGSGWGHGVGLSQWGAYGLAAKGWSVNKILTQFYKGTTVGPAPSMPSQIRVGLLQNVAGVQITAQTAATNLRLGNAGGPIIAQIPVGQTWSVEVKNGTYWIKRADGTYVGNKGYGTSTTSLIAGYYKAAVVLPQTGHTYTHGWLELNIYQPCTGCALKLRVIQVLSWMQQYLNGVAESPVDWPSTPHQVQAIASRTYALWLIATYGQHRPVCNCGVWSTTKDQYYVGSDRELASSGATWINAVAATNGTTVLYGGAVIQANFYASSGGFTENTENVWGGTAYPYLRGVCDPGDYTSANPNRVWKVSMTGTTVGAKVKAYTGTDIGAATGFSSITRGVSGRIESITVNGMTGSKTLTGLAFRAALGLKDDRVWFGQNLNVEGKIRGTYDVRMCAPGLATSPQTAVTGGAYQTFANGRIYLNNTTGKAYWLPPGPILTKYLALGGNTSILGLPTSGVTNDSVYPGQRAYFLGGRMFWSSAGGAHELHGLVLTRYMALGQQTSSLGYPTTDIVVVDADHQKATFQNGTITCTISTSTCT